MPLSHFFAFKRERKEVATSEGAQAAQEAAQKHAARVDAKFQKRFHVADDGGARLACSALTLVRGRQCPANSPLQVAPAL